MMARRASSSAQRIPDNTINNRGRPAVPPAPRAARVRHSAGPLLADEDAERLGEVLAGVLLSWWKETGAGGKASGEAAR